MIWNLRKSFFLFQNSKAKKGLVIEYSGIVENGKKSREEKLLYRVKYVIFHVRRYHIIQRRRITSFDP